MSDESLARSRCDSQHRSSFRTERRWPDGLEQVVVNRAAAFHCPISGRLSGCPDGCTAAIATTRVITDHATWHDLCIAIAECLRPRLLRIIMSTLASSHRLPSHVTAASPSTACCTKPSGAIFRTPWPTCKRHPSEPRSRLLARSRRLFEPAPRGALGVHRRLLAAR